MLKEVIPHYRELSSAEKLLLVEELWDHLAEEPAEVPVPEWQKAELLRRYEEYLSNPGEGAPWAEVRDRIVGTIR